MISPWLVLFPLAAVAGAYLVTGRVLGYATHRLVDVPNDRTGEQIYQDLLTHLTYADEHKDQWPSDVNDGYRMFAHHVLMALYGVPVNEKAMGSSGS